MSSWTSNGGIPPTTPVRRSGTRWLQKYNFDLYCLRVPPAHGYPRVDTRSLSRPEPRFGGTMSCSSIMIILNECESVFFSLQMKKKQFFSFRWKYLWSTWKILRHFRDFFEKITKKQRENRSWSTKYWFFRLRRAKTKNSIANLSLIWSI